MKKIAVNALAGVLAACVLSSQTLAQPAAEYPTKPVRFVVVFAPGGGVDVVGRLVADRLTRSWGQTVVVENRSGAGGTIATEYVARSAADGYTLLLTSNNHNINAFMYRNPGYDPRKDFAAVAQLSAAPSVLVTRSQSPYRSVKDVVNAARADPGKLVYGSAGHGSSTNLAGELFKRAANIDLTHIPYKGGGLAKQDVMGGQIPLAMSALPSVMPHIQDKMLRALAVTSETRWPALPDVPSIAESGYPGFRHLTWIGVFVPAATPSPLVARLNREIANVLAIPDMRERIIGLGAEPVGKSPADFEAMLKADYEAMGQLMAQIGLKAD